MRQSGRVWTRSVRASREISLVNGKGDLGTEISRLSSVPATDIFRHSSGQAGQAARNDGG